jgi:hypothetical protein
VHRDARFGREPANAKDLHLQLSAADDLDEIPAWRQNGRGSGTPEGRAVNYPDGQLKGRSLPLRIDKIQTVQLGTIVDNKRLSAVLAMVKARQADYAPKRRRVHVARQRPSNNIDAPGCHRMGGVTRCPGSGGHLTASG